MASKKQRRRREKLKRHEWEMVQLDEEGNEVLLEEPPAKKAATNGKPTTQRRRRPMREVKPPSWSRAAKRGLLFVPFLYIFLSIGKSAPPVATRIAYSALYAVVFIPMFFFIDRMAYRAYQKRLSQQP